MFDVLTIFNKRSLFSNAFYGENPSVLLRGIKILSQVRQTEDQGHQSTTCLESDHHHERRLGGGEDVSTPDGPMDLELELRTSTLGVVTGRGGALRRFESPSLL